jgi:hypothetical protein
MRRDKQEEKEKKATDLSSFSLLLFAVLLLTLTGDYA